VLFAEFLQEWEQPAAARNVKTGKENAFFGAKPKDEERANLRARAMAKRKKLARHRKREKGKITWIHGCIQ
jgi:hypothetical protein